MVVVDEDTVRAESAEVEQDRLTLVSVAFIVDEEDEEAIADSGCRDILGDAADITVLSDTVRCMMGGDSMLGCIANVESRGVRRRAPISRLRLPGVRRCLCTVCLPVLLIGLLSC